MMTKDQIDKAKRANLPCVLQTMGVTLIPEGNGYHLSEHDSLKFFKQNGIWIYKWWSQGGEAGDGIDYLKRYHGLGFYEAVRALLGSSVFLNKDRHKFRSQDQSKQSEAWHTNEWQLKSEKLIRIAQSYLFGPNGKERLCYLVYHRGLRLDTVQKHRLGWLPAKDHIPSRLLIPCYDIKRNLVRIRFRIDTPENERYRISRGSSAHHSFPLGINKGKAVIIVESELDAMLIEQEAMGIIGVIGLGSTGVKFTSEMISFLNKKVPVTLISLDNDRSGQMKTDVFSKAISNSIVWPVPEKYGKDPGEAWKKMDIRRWVEEGLDQHVRFKI